jgi:hypothetical protein
MLISLLQVLVDDCAVHSSPVGSGWRKGVNRISQHDMTTRYGTERLYDNTTLFGC